MTDTTDTAQIIERMKRLYGIGGASGAAIDALERLAAENAELRADLATHVPVLLEWLGENVTDDPAYLSAVDWARGVNKMAEGKGDE